MSRHTADAASVDSLVDLERRWAHLGRLLLALVVSWRGHAPLLGAALYVGTSSRHEFFFPVIFTLVDKFVFVRVRLVFDHFGEALVRPSNFVATTLSVLYLNYTGHARPNTAAILISSDFVESHFKLIFLSFH